MMISINIINSVNIINIMSCLDRQDEPTSHRNLHLSLSFCREVLAHVWVEIIIIIILPPMAQSSFHWVLILIHGRFSCTCSWRKIFTTIERPATNGQVGQSSEVKLSTRSRPSCLHNVLYAEDGDDTEDMYESWMLWRFGG